MINIQAVVGPSLPVMSADAVDAVKALGEISLQHEQIPFTTKHLIHAGMYARTIMIPADSLITGVLIKCATIVVVSGDVTVATGDGSIRLTGYNVVPASAHRAQVFRAHSDTYLTAIFPTQAKTIEEAESELTDETDKLASRNNENVIVITGET